MYRTTRQITLPFAKLVVLLILPLLLSGCIGSSSPVIKFYLLNPVNGQPPGGLESGPLHIEITAVRLPQYLQRPQIVTRSGDNRLNLSEFNQWGGNLRKNMLRTLSVNLSRLLNTPNIAIAPYRSVAQPDFRIAIDIIKFEKDHDHKVRLSAQWRISSGKTGTIVAARISELESTGLTAATNYDSTVNAMATLYGQLSEIIAQAIIQAETPTPL